MLVAATRTFASMSATICTTLPKKIYPVSSNTAMVSCACARTRRDRNPRITFEPVLTGRDFRTRAYESTNCTTDIASPMPIPSCRPTRLIARKVAQTIAYSAIETLWKECTSQSSMRSIAMKTSTAPKKKCGRKAATFTGEMKSSSSAMQSTNPTMRELVAER